MAERSRLYTRFRVPHSLKSEHEIEKINLVILDVGSNHLITINPEYEVKIFNDDEPDLWFDYITSGITNIHLFMSNAVGNTFLQFICEYPQITSIYVFYKNKQFQTYSYTDPKLRGLFDDFTSMFKQFQNDIVEPETESFSDERTFRNINSITAKFLWLKFYDEVIQRIRHTKIAKDEFTAFCRRVYTDNERLLKQVKEFEDGYTSNKAINWYTRESFLYQLLNLTLRTRKNLNNQFKMRLILTDLIFGLKTVQLDSHYLPAYPFYVYRGQTMSIQDMNQLKSGVGILILFDTFLSTSLDRTVARIFAQNSDPHSSIQVVLFTIEIDSEDGKNTKTPFANISSLSYYEVEEEVLFSMHSTFRIESVQQGEDNLWNIHLKLVDKIWDIDFGERSIFSPHADQIFIRHLSKESKQLIAFQLLLDMILRLDQTTYAKDELIEFARSKYQDDATALKQIQKFENEYRSEDAAEWYTKDSFLYRLLNESLRIEVVDSIVKLKYFIHDLHNQLAQLQPFFIDWLNEVLPGDTEVTLYRGQTMKVDQLDEIRANVGGFISTNSFLSATLDEQVAITFSGDGKSTNADEVSVVYEILIDTNIRSTPYAIVDSINPDEQEILFSMGTSFRIGEVDELRDRVYRVKLTMAYIKDGLWNKLTAHLDDD